MKGSNDFLLSTQNIALVISKLVDLAPQVKNILHFCGTRDVTLTSLTVWQRLLYVGNGLVTKLSRKSNKLYLGISGSLSYLINQNISIYKHSDLRATSFLILEPKPLEVAITTSRLFGHGNIDRCIKFLFRPRQHFISKRRVSY